MAEATKKVALDKSITTIEVKNHELLKVAYEAYLSQSRTVSGHTKTRGEVSGGGKKPWKQKGTGRARFGSSRNPIWRAGGIVFGPRGIENYTKKLSTGAKHTALRQALSLAEKAEKFIVVSDFKVTGKTKEFVAFLEKNKITDRRVLVVVDAKTPELLRSTANIQNVIVVRATYLSVYHLLNADKIVITHKAVDAVNEWLVKGDK